MKDRLLRRTFMVLMLLVAVIATGGLMIGCAGDDGAAGAPGATGPAGPAGPVTSTGESCNVCHSTGQLADFAPWHPDPTAANVVISNVTLTNIGGVAQVSFHATVGGANLTTLANTEVRFYIADMLPAGIASAATGTTYSTPHFEMWAYERNSTGYTFGTWDATGAANGNYGYTFATAFGSATSNAQTTLTNADYDPTHVQRLLIRISSNTTANRNGAAGFLDFTVPAAGNAAVALDSQRQFVTIDACRKCHGPQLLAAAHGGGYVDTRACVLCHSPLYQVNTTDELAGFMDDPLNVTMPVFIHQIHASITNPEFPDRIGGKGWEGVTYPQDKKNCVVCHTNSGLNLGTGDQIDNWKEHPNGKACNSCHIGNTLNANGTTTHSAAAVTAGAPSTPRADSTCTGCHGITDIEGYHDTTPTGMNVPEFDVTLSLTAPANGTHFVSGETVTVTATLVTHGTATPVAGTVYTTARDAAAGSAGGGLRVASLYLSGPRAKALPLLGTQAISLFTGGTDTRVKTDATGFKYQFVVPTGATAGTYGVRVRFGDYSRVSDTNYKIESTAFKTIQISTATVEKKIDGDMCVNCHGAGTAPFHDARHSVVFDTDECATCHDLSGGHADPIANRVHAVHGARVNSDLRTIDWSAVTYPQGIVMGPTTTAASQGAKICVGCHTSGNTAYKTNALGSACYGCHGDSTVVTDHMLQNGGPVMEE